MDTSTGEKNQSRQAGSLPAHLLEGAALLAALLLRLLWARESLDLPILRTPVLDCEYYHAWGASLARGEAGPAVYYMSPLYAWFLGLLYRLAGQDPLLPRLLQAALGTLTAWLCARLAGSLAGRWAAVLAAWIFALHGTAVFFSGVLLGTTLAMLLAAALAWVALGTPRRRPASALLAGLLLGLLALERPNLLVLAPALLWIQATAAATRALRLRRCGLAVLGLLGALAPATLHNLRGGDRVLISSNGGVNLYLGNHSGAEGVYASVPGLPDDPGPQYAASLALAGEALGRAPRPSEASRWWARRARDELLRSPWRALALLGKKILLLINAEEAQLNFRFDFFRRRSRVLSLAWISFGLLLPLALAGAILSSSPTASSLRWLIALHFASLLPFFVAGRFRMPAVPWLVALAAAALIEAARRRGARLAVAAGAALSLALVGQLPLLRQNDAAMWNLSGTLEEQAARTAAAEEDYRRALAEEPTHAAAAANLARLLLARHRPAEAAALLAPIARPARLSALLGRAWWAAGEVERAVLAFEAAVAEEPRQAGTWNALGAARARLGDTARARTAFETALRIDPGFAPARANLARLVGLERPSPHGLPR